MRFQTTKSFRASPNKIIVWTRPQKPWCIPISIFKVFQSIGNIFCLLEDKEITDWAYSVSRDGLAVSIFSINKRMINGRIIYRKCSIRFYHLLLILISFLHSDLINVTYLTASAFIRSSWSCTFWMTFVHDVQLIRKSITTSQSLVWRVNQRALRIEL